MLRQEGYSAVDGKANQSVKVAVIVSTENEFLRGNLRSLTKVQGAQGGSVAGWVFYYNGTKRSRHRSPDEGIQPVYHPLNVPPFFDVRQRRRPGGIGPAASRSPMDGEPGIPGSTGVVRTLRFTKVASLCILLPRMCPERAGVCK